MSRIIIISNRLPITLRKNGDDLEYTESIGGLSTGLKCFHDQADSIWVGWPGIPDEELSDKEKECLQKKLEERYQCLPVFLSNLEIDQYYNRFSNKTIWPLFHYFSNITEFDFDTWDYYKSVNQKFFDTLEPIIGENNVIWIHDYQLMLLPQMIKEKYPNTQVGFFLHIPFPSFEIFRLLIWREEVLKGILGADLIGFHTYDYVRHFLSCTRRLLGLEDELNRISYEDRYVRVDAFPMGIDYNRFNNECIDREFLESEVDIQSLKDTKIILSIDRLDYTKGIPQRIKAFSRFLSKYPEYREKVRLNLIVAPSRVKIDSYDLLLREIQETVSEINGEFGTLSWMPVWFFFRSFTQKNLIAFFRNSDVLLVTPLRDGMNLVAKEYIAARADYEGMVVISETAGAASELGEAVIVNANDYDAIAYGIKTALDMPREEKIARNKIMHRRLQRYNIEFWASEFLQELNRTVEDTAHIITQISLDKESYNIEATYKNALKRILFLDYDGTLVGYKAFPDQAKPDEELRSLLLELTSDSRNTVVIISGRDKTILEEWLGDINDLYLVGSHGLWIRYPDQKDWIMTSVVDNKWKESVRPILELYSDRMPGSLIEEKDFSLAWHYRQCDPDMVGMKLGEVRETLKSMTASSTLMLQEGNKVLEIKDSRVNKGYITSLIIENQGYDFILGAGDDYTDEDMFSSLQEDSYSIKIGLGNTRANYRLKSWRSMRMILEKLIGANVERILYEEKTICLRSKSRVRSLSHTAK